MKRPRLALSRLAIVVFVMTPQSSSASGRGDPTLVRIEGGTVRGTVSDGVVAFRGIPFARPPFGALRWRPPQAVTPWAGTLDASQLKPDCAQMPVQGTSEDCLYLDVWRSASSAGALPVLVWIPGGALVSGGASLYPGEGLARQGIVVVTVNYRLGRFGFFAHPALVPEAPGEPIGNYGYLDQIAALEWVQRNISAFGGDPGNVTIAGQSAGGGSVLVMLTSPMARGLFHRAILESLGVPGPRSGVVPVRGLAAAEALAVTFARSVGVEGEGSAAASALRALSTETLAEGADLDSVLAAFARGRDVPGVSGPILDGQVIVEPPEAVLRGGRQARVPVISGANDHDIALGAAENKAELFAQFGAMQPEARMLYDPFGDATLESLIQAVYADRMLIEPSRHVAELMTQAGQRAYFYRFSYVASSLRGVVPGALHGDEIPYVFDFLPWVLEGHESQEDLAMARTVSGYWVAFMQTGDPNGGGRPEWPPYDPTQRSVLDFTTRGVSFGPDPLRARLDLWGSVWSQCCGDGAGGAISE